MPEQRSLTVNVNARFAIDAGSWQECAEEDQTPYRLVSPPYTTMYRQVLSYLEETTRGQKVPSKSQVHFGEVAIATVALCIRWGSYFAVLVNRDLPQWAAAFDPEVSCLGGPLRLDRPPAGRPAALPQAGQSSRPAPAFPHRAARRSDVLQALPGV